jgi:predicted methyltransferase
LHNRARGPLEFFLRLLLALALPAAAAGAPQYSTIAATPDGIGKVYLGREISHVMGYAGAQWLERTERMDEERPDLVLNALDLKPGMAVADIGAGTGFYAWRIAQRVGATGMVYAVDVQPEMIKSP